MAASAVPSVTLGNFTGIDFNELLEAVLENAEVPETSLQNEVTADNSEISALGQIGSSFTSLQSSLTQLNTDATTAPLAASTSAGAPFSASVTGSPVVGTYDVSVNSLANAQVSGSQGYDSANDVVGTGTIGISIGGNTTTLNIDSTDDTLTGVATAINNAALGITAQVTDTGLPGDPYRLQLSSNSTGLAGAFSISTNLSGGNALDFGSSSIGAVQLDSVTGSAPITIGGDYTGTLSQGYQFTVASGGTIGSSSISIDYTSDSGESGTITIPQDYTPGSQIAVADGIVLSLGDGTLNTGDQFSVAAFNPSIVSAQNASVQIGNQIVSSSTNDVSNAIPGVTLSLASTGGPSEVTVSQDETSLGNDVSSFVSAYNQLISQIDSDTQAQPNTTAPALANDGGLESAVDGLQFALGTINLSTLGISIDSQTGALQFDSTTFASQFQSDPSQVTASMASIYQALNDQVTDALDPNTGVIASQTNSANTQITDLNQQISTMQSQIQQEENQLQTEYASIQASVSSYQNLSELLSAEDGSSSSSSSGSSSSLPGSTLSLDG